MLSPFCLANSKPIITASCPIYKCKKPLIKPFINEVSRKKIKIVSAKNTFECINEFVHENDIPTEYGGKLVCGEGGEDNCRWYSPEEVAYRNHVYATNKRYAEQRRLKEEMKQTNDFKNSE